MKVNAGGDPATSDETAPVENEAVGVGEADPFGHFRAVISSLPPVVFVVSLMFMDFLVTAGPPQRLASVISLDSACNVR